MTVVAAIVVTYFPRLDGLLASIRSLISQVDYIFIVDNGSSMQKEIADAISMLSTVTFEPLKINVGLGTAINMGVDFARCRGVSHVVLMDQDSLPRPEMVGVMMRHLLGDSVNQRVAAIGPCFIDANNGAISQHVHFETLRIGRIPCPENAPFVSTDFLITSGSLIPLHVLDDVGPMDETLFIDHVDTEWCLRARSKGYVLLGDCEALMEHDLGEYRKRIWFFRWREVPVHKAFRYYYIFRNSFLLYRRKYIPWAWIRIDLIRLIQIFGFTLLFGPDRLGKIAMMFRGVRDAFLGKSGKFGS